MIDILLPMAVANYDMSKPPGPDNPTCGMGLKFARVEDALRRRYPDVRRVSNIEDVTAETVIVEASWFRMPTREERLARLDTFLRKAFSRVLLYGSEQFPMVMPDEIRRALIPNVTWVTHCSAYQKEAFRTRGIFHSEYLCDPIPDMFAPTPKVQRIYTASQIGWDKRTQDLIEIYKALRYTDIETVFIGSATMWGDRVGAKEQSLRFRLQAELREICDVYIGNASSAEVATWANASMHHVHVSQHDCSSPNQEEAALSGCVLWGMAHPMNTHRPVYQYARPSEIVDGILKLDASLCAMRSEEVRQYAQSQWSYEAFLQQFEFLLQGR